MRRQFLRRGISGVAVVAVRTSLAFCFPFSLARAPLFPFALRPRAVRPPSSNESESDPELILSLWQKVVAGWDGNPARGVTNFNQDFNTTVVILLLLYSTFCSMVYQHLSHGIVRFKQVVCPNTPDPQYGPLKLSQHLLYCISQHRIAEPFHFEPFCS